MALDPKEALSPQRTLGDLIKTLRGTDVPRIHRRLRQGDCLTARDVSDLLIILDIFVEQNK